MMFNKLNPFRNCQEYRIKLWQCPQFLFLIMGFIIIFAIIATQFVASRFVNDSRMVIVIVTLTTAILFVISKIIVSAFEFVAQSLQAKSEFVSIMSHELRGPLAAIKWQINLMNRIKPDPEDLPAMIGAIEDKNEEMIKIVNKLLEVNRIEGTGIALNPGKFSLKTVAKNIIEESSSFASFSNVSILIKSDDDPFYVYADESKIKDVLRHLIDNAIRYSFKNNEVLILFEKDNVFVKCTVIDKGMGISSKDSKKIFTKFFRNQSIIRYQSRGTGIGLFIAKAIIDASEGEIKFTSVEGRGSTFWFTLPVFLDKYDKQ